jgi:hypothetical protein
MIDPPSHGSGAPGNPTSESTPADAAPPAAPAHPDASAQPAAPSGGAGWPKRLRRWRQRAWLGWCVAALAMLGVGAIFWNSSLPYRGLTTVAEQNGAPRALYTYFPASGAYMISGSRGADNRSTEDLQDIQLPATIYVRYHGEQPWWLSVTCALGINFLIVWLIALAMRVVPEEIGRPRRFCSLAFIGFAVALFSIVSDPISWASPPIWNGVIILHTLIAWLTAASILTFFVIPPDPSPPPDQPAPAAPS